MTESLIALAGLWFLVACGVEFLTVFVEQAGAARAPEDEAPRRHGFLALLTFIASLLTPGLLLAHGFLVTHDQEQTLRIVAMGLPVAAMLLGSLLGALFGAIARALAGAMRMIALPLSLATLAVTIYATLPSINVLIDAAQNNWTIVTP
jgi:hypothetical protein